MEISKNDIVKLLRLNSMSKTPSRVSLIFLLAKANSWLSLQDVSKQMKQSRTTIYRALNILCEKAIVKKIQ
jgi:Fe2+ or Zn2+ uptake regulation protein